MGGTHQRRKGVPGPKGQHEAEPRKEKDAAMGVDRVEDGHGAGLLVDGVEDWRAPEIRGLEAHPSDDEVRVAPEVRLVGCGDRGGQRRSPRVRRVEMKWCRRCLTRVVQTLTTSGSGPRPLRDYIFRAPPLPRNPTHVLPTRDRFDAKMGGVPIGNHGAWWRSSRWQSPRRRRVSLAIVHLRQRFDQMASPISIPRPAVRAENPHP